MRKKWKDIWPVIVILGLIIGFIASVALLMHHNSKGTEYEYDLCEIDDGVYAVYYTTHSRAPAYNYEVVTLCCGGAIRIFKGHVHIEFTDGKPHARARISNMINSDEVYVYVPKGTVVYQPSVDIGR